MAVKFEIYLSDEDTERLFAVKEDTIVLRPLESGVKYPPEIGMTTCCKCYSSVISK